MRTLLIFGLFFLFLAPAQSQVFKAAAAVRNITPDPLLPVSGGVGSPNQVSEKKGDLFVRALVFEKDELRTAIVSIDNLGWPAALGDKSRELISGIAPENILIGVTHTHSAPDAYGFPDENGEVGADMDYLAWCVEQIAEAVNEAVENLEPAYLKTTVDEARGKIAYNYYAPELYDRRMGVIQALAAGGKNQGKAIATLVNYASHPEIIGSERGILTPDFCGPMYDRIEENGGGIGLYMNGAQGGMVTADNRRENDREANDWAECIRIGELMADEALRIVKDAEIQENPELYCTSRIVEFPVESQMMQYILKNSPLGLGALENNMISTRINLLNIGSAQAITIPGEALPNIGFYIKRKMPTDDAFLFGLTNDAFGYLLTPEDFNSFDRYAYISRTSLGEMTGEIYIEEVLKLIKESPNPGE